MSWPLPHADFLTYSLLLLLAALNLFHLLAVGAPRQAPPRSAQGDNGRQVLGLLKTCLFLGVVLLAFGNPLWAGRKGLLAGLSILLAGIVECWATLGPMRRLTSLLALISPVEDLAEDNLSKLKYAGNRRLYRSLKLISTSLLVLACVLAAIQLCA